MSEINATRDALDAAVCAGLIQAWEEHKPEFGFLVTRDRNRHPLTSYGVRAYLSIWIALTAGACPEVLHKPSWRALLDRMEDLAETCRWQEVRP